MNKDPLVSIIISSYNYGRFLGKAIDSALEQTYQHKEVIVVDDGSTDDSLQIIEGYGAAIKAIFKQNGGQASAFNAGFKISKGDVIIFLDSDDILLSSALEKAIRCFDRPEIVKVHWPLWKINANGEKTGEIDPTDTLAVGDLLDQAIKYGPNYCGGPPNSPPTSGISWARSYLEQIFPIPEAEYKTCTDQYLLVLAPVYGQLRSLSEPHGLYRIHGDNYSLIPFLLYVQENVNRFEQNCLLLSSHLSKKGISIDPETWPRDSWYHKIQESVNEIIKIVPPAASFILVDDNCWGTGDEVDGRQRILFTERGGQYWGAPSDDESAIEEIERHRQEGVDYIFFAWPAFWLYEHSKDMKNHLKVNYQRILNNERLIAFKLQSKFSV
jgi:glycosyltransferase involved in cell wall biosynthesis